MTTWARNFKFAGTPVQKLHLAMVVLTQKMFSVHYAWYSRGGSHMLVLNILLVRVSSILALSSFIPTAIQLCKCSIMISSISFFLHLFNICYQPYMLVSLAVFQLMIIKGKKKLVSLKTVGVTLITITAVTIAVPIIFISIATKDNGELSSVIVQ